MMNICSDLLTGLKTTYALVDLQGRIIAHDPLFSVWAIGKESPLIGQPLGNIFPELVGQEEELDRVRRGEKPSVRIAYIHRLIGTSPQYLTLTVIRQGNGDAGWIALLTDATSEGKFCQELNQSRNELLLLRWQLERLNAQLDYLLHHYLAPEIAEALLKGELRPELGGKLEEASILFGDIRDFTPLAEKLSPDHVVQLLNSYFEVVSGAIKEAVGIVVQFLGDAVMALFTSSTPSEHAERAVRAGIAIQQRVHAYQKQRPPAEPRLSFGIGIHTGQVLVGNVGAQWRYTYTAIGDAVNLASRLTAIVPPGEIWISQTTWELLGNAVDTVPLDPRTFRGKSQPVSLFRVVFEHNTR